MKKHILIKVTPAKATFLIQLGSLLSNDHNVTFVTRPSLVSLIQQISPHLSANIDTSLDNTHDIKDELLLEECLEREKKYGENFALIMSHERGLGKGYIFNADLHPDLKRARWNHSQKLRNVLSQFKTYERIFAEIKPDVVVGMYIERVLSLVAKSNNVLDLSLVNAKFGDRYLWAENGYTDNPGLSKAVLTHVKNPQLLSGSIQSDYKQVSVSKMLHQKVDYSYNGALLTVLRRLRKSTYWFVRIWLSRLYRRSLSIGKRPPGRGAINLGWYKPILKRPAMYKYFVKNGVTPDDISEEYRLIYIPLHLEPEVALLSVSPEFNNSWEMISWISKASPANTLLVVKEQPFSFGIRSKGLYEHLRRMPNVVLAHPKVHPWEWIMASQVTATITGTAAIEAINMSRRVLSFGCHQFVNLLPTVRFASDYTSTLKGLNDLLMIKDGDSSFDLSRKSLNKAQIDNSFEMVGIEYPKLSPEDEEGLAQVAKEALCKFYPHHFQVDEK